VFLIMTQCDTSASVMFEVMAVMNMNTFFRDMAPCSTVDKYHCCEET
jgi:hypothetical protein